MYLCLFVLNDCLERKNIKTYQASYLHLDAVLFKKVFQCDNGAFFLIE